MRSVRAVTLTIMSIAILVGYTGCSSREPAAYHEAGDAPAPSAGGTASPRAYAPAGADRTGQTSVIPGQTTPSRDEELWVIAKADAPAKPAPSDDVPGAGALVARLPDRAQPVPVPLKHTDVKADLYGYVATVDVTQQYHNPFASKIEAVYVFPLPHNAAVSEFVMTVGERKIRGVIRERAQAEQIYADARRQGYVASLLTQERPNVFTQSVANIEPGKRIDISVRYFHTLAYVDGWYEWHFPMVVGPRFNPPVTIADDAAVAAAVPAGSGIGAAPPRGGGASGQATEVQYLRPGERSGHDVALNVKLDAGVALEELKVTSHSADVRTDGPRATVALSPSDAIPNKDFVLRYRVAGDAPKAAILATRDSKQEGQPGYFTLMLYPPRSLDVLPRRPVELVYVIDCSGSMNGQPIAQANAAVRHALTKMRPDDTFQIVRFSGDAQAMTDRPVPATPENVRRAIAHLNKPYGGGGTMLLEGMKKALDFPADPGRLRFVCFLTDGFIGNEAQILGEIHNRLGGSRIFSFGVGSSVNRYLLDHMAKMGRGAVAYLALNEKAEPVMDAFFERVSHAALTDVTIDWGGMGVSDVHPSPVPDLFVGRPVILTGRFTGAGTTEVRVTGRAAGQTTQMPLTLNLDATGADKHALRPIWARTKIAGLSDRATWDGSVDLPGQVKTLALEHGLMSPFTAFLAVDATRQTEGAYGTRVAVPVPVPEAVRYETTVPPK